MRQTPMLLPKAAKIFLAACLSLLALLSAGQTRAALQCGPFDNANQVGTCLSGVPQYTFFNGGLSRWEWECVGGGQSVFCFEAACGNGVIDFGEACDGGNLNGKSCTDFPGYIGGNLTCRADCKVYVFDGCTRAEVCGDGKAEGVEPCDGADLKGQTCASQGKGSGSLKCYPKGDPKQCSFDDSGCQWCGDNKINGAEQCDGLSLNNKTCTDFGFIGGDLACFSQYESDPLKRCQFDTEACISTTEICGNGKAEGDEECDGFDFRGQTCFSKGCSGGNLRCDKSCKIEIDTGDGFPLGCQRACVKVGGCTKTISGPWGSSVFAKPCLECGWAHEQFLDAKPTAGLCSAFNGGANLMPAVSEVKNSLGQVYKWAWKCGTQSCEAYAEARCRADVSASSLCLPDKDANALFKTKTDWSAKINQRPQTNAYCDVGSIVQQMADGTPINQHCSSKGWDASKNIAWVCQNTIGTSGDKISYAYCSSGWGDKSACGTANGLRYDPTNGLIWRGNDSVGRDVGFDSANPKCSRSNFWNSNQWASGELCANGSQVIEKKYELGPMMANGSYKPKLTWKCQWNQPVKSINGATVDRRGEIVNCSATADPCYLNAPGVDGVCGSDAFGNFPRLRANQPPAYTRPGSEKINGKDQLCAIGLATEPVYNSLTYQWTWTCKGDSLRNGKDAKCSVKMKAACGPADGRGFIDETSLRNYGKGSLTPYGPCGVGRLRGDQVFKTGKGWLWYCENPDDPTLNIACSASMCGAAHAQVYSQPSFDIESAKAGFICAEGGTASPSKPLLAYDQIFRTYRWTWDCSYPGGKVVSGCYASELRCGWATDNPAVYSTANFNNKKSVYSTFLCPGGAENVRSLKENEGNWIWQCLGRTSAGSAPQTIDCQAAKYSCGVLSGSALSSAKLLEVSNNQPSFLSQLCSHNGEIYSLNTYPIYSSELLTMTWECKAPGENRASTKTCSATRMTCGSLAGGVLTQATITSRYAQTDNGGLFCAGNNVSSSQPLAVQDSQGKWLWSWSCLDGLGGTVSCTASKLDCQPKASDGVGIESSKFWHGCQADGLPLCNLGCDSDAYLSDPGSGNSLISRSTVAGSYFNASAKKWTWKCRDSYGGKTDECSAFCSDCK